MLRPCDRCGGKVMVDRAYCKYGHVELFCIICGNRWEFHRDTAIARAINVIERRREYGINGVVST
jgi:hypothetical protein